MDKITIDMIYSVLEVNLQHYPPDINLWEIINNQAFDETDPTINWIDRYTVPRNGIYFDDEDNVYVAEDKSEATMTLEEITEDMSLWIVDDPQSDISKWIDGKEEWLNKLRKVANIDTTKLVNENVYNVLEAMDMILLDKVEHRGVIRNKHLERVLLIEGINASEWLEGIMFPVYNIPRQYNWELFNDRVEDIWNITSDDITEIKNKGIITAKQLFYSIKYNIIVVSSYIEELSPFIAKEYITNYDITVICAHIFNKRLKNKYQESKVSIENTYTDDNIPLETECVLGIEVPPTVSEDEIIKCVGVKQIFFEDDDYIWGYVAIDNLINTYYQGNTVIRVRFSIYSSGTIEPDAVYRRKNFNDVDWGIISGKLFIA